MEIVFPLEIGVFLLKGSRDLAHSLLELRQQVQRTRTFGMAPKNFCPFFEYFFSLLSSYPLAIFSK